MYKLVIGNKNYSTWSLRAWLCLKLGDVPFEEINLAMFTPGWLERVAAYSPAGRVPVLRDGELSVWDSLAICEHVRESYPGALDWPREQAARARARSISAEMHAGFLAIREELPMNIRRTEPREVASLSDACRAQIRRVEEIWTSCLNDHGGPWLFGDEPCIADAFYAPVALRFHTYAIPIGRQAQSYVHTIRENEHVRGWCRDAEGETEQLDFIDNLAPLDQTPLIQG